MTRRLVLAIVVLHLVIAPSPAADDLLSKCVWHFKHFALWTLAKNWSHQTIQLPIQSSGRVTLTTGRRIAFGGWGGVYDLKTIEAPAPPAWNRPMVVKFPHGIRAAPGPLGITDRENVGEAAKYQILHQPLTLERIQRDGEFPKNPAWRLGQLPVVPQVAFQTPEGTILVKPFVSGPTLRELYFGNRMTPQMIASVEEIYALTRAIGSKVKRVVVLQDRTIQQNEEPFVTDVNPNNLVWVSDPVDLAFFGLSRPSFLFYEMTALHNRPPQFLKLPAIGPDEQPETIPVRH